MKQISIFDLMKKDEPKCYSCRNAKKRGPWRLCEAGGKGYKHKDEDIACDLYIWEELM